MPDVRSALASAWGRPPAPGAPPPQWRDWVLAGVLCAAALVEGVARTDLAWPAASTGVAVTLMFALPWRRTRPLAAAVVPVVVGSGLELAGAAAGHDDVVLATSAALVLLPYALYRWGRGRDVVVGTVVLLAGAAVSVVAGGGGPADAIGGTVVLLLAMSIGEIVRQRVTGRARDLDEARHRERARIARDLHDTVAHHVSAMAVRAQAGQAAAPTDPAAAVDALAVIEGEAKAALAEMRTVVGALRGADEPALRPAPGLADLAALAGPAPAGAPEVRVRGVDAVGPLDEQVAAALYRVAAEAVTNARRHARAATGVDVVLDRAGETVRLYVHDDGRAAVRTASGAPGGGFGLVGMAERAAALGGTCAAGPDPAGGWTVEVTLPAGGARLRG